MISNIVISGMSGRFPNSRSIEELEFNLYNKIDMIDDNECRWRHTSPEVVKRFGKVYDLEKFDASFFGVNKNLAICMDPQIRILCEVAYEAIMDAGLNPIELSGSNTGVYTGMGFSESTENWNFHMNDFNSAVLGNSGFMSANWLSYFLNLKGPSLRCDTGCSSAGYALDLAVSAIRKGDIDAALVMGTNLILNPYNAIQFNRLGVLSQDGFCRTFDAQACGYVRSDAMVAIFLQRKDRAKRIYSHVIYSKTNSDGYKDLGITRPSSDVQKCMWTEALTTTEISVDDIGYSEAHGTGTPLGDLYEASALDSVIASMRTSPLSIGSVKSNLGHSENSSALCSLVKVILALEKGLIAPNLHFEIPNPKIEGLLNGRLNVLTEVTELKKPYVTVNSFGVGGSNANFILRQHRKSKTTLPVTLPRLVLWSGRTKESVEVMFDNISAKPLDLEHIALLHNIQNTETPLFPARGYGIFVREEGKNDTKCLSSRISLHNEGTRPLVWIFSGMGSAWNQMGKDLLRIPSFKSSIARCAVITKELGIDLMEILTSKDPSLFANVQYQLIGITAMQIALVNLLKELNVVPDYIIGHSAGEVACGYADGALSEEQALRTSFYRANPQDDFEGGMAAVGLSHKDVLSHLPEDIDVACHNSSTSCTISGPAASIKNCVKKLTESGIFAKHVNSSGVAYHSRYIAPLRGNYEKFIDSFIPNPKKRSTKWISTCFETPSSEESQFASAKYYGQNFISPVLFEEGCHKLPANSLTLEISPQALLLPIVKSEMKSGLHFGITKRGNLEGVNYFLESLGELYNLGINFDISKLYPKVEFPVARGTRGISSFIRWNHSEDWLIPDNAITTGSGGKTMKISLKDRKFAFLKNFVIDGNIMIPPTMYMMIVWDLLNEKHKGVEFSDLYFLKQINLSVDKYVELDVNIQSGSGQFEITHEGDIVCSGAIKNLSQNSKFMESTGECSKKILKSVDFYTELKLRGYDFSDNFKSVEFASYGGTSGSVQWKSDEVSFLEGMIQVFILGFHTREIILLRRIKHLKIRPMVNQKTPVMVNCLRKLSMITCPSVEISGMDFGRVPKQKQTHESILSSRMFVPLISPEMTILNAANLVVQLYLENNQKVSLKIVEVKSEENLVTENFKKVISSSPLMKCSFDVQSSEAIDKIDCDILITSVVHEKYQKFLKDTSYLVLRTFNGNMDLPGLQMISKISLKDRNDCFLIYQRRTKSCYQKVNEVYPSENINWLEEIKVSLPTVPVLICDNGAEYLRRVQCEAECKTVIISKEKLSNDAYNQQLELGLSINVYEDGIWGTYRNMNISKISYYSPSSQKRISANFTDEGKLQWSESDNQSDPLSIDVVFYALTSRDSIFKNTFIFEFSGFQKKTNKRFIGIANHRRITSDINSTPLSWEIPESWSLQESTLVPLRYITVYYAFFHRFSIKRKQTVLIQSGNKGIGLEAICLALAYGLNVYTTCKDKDDKQYLLETFKSLKESQIFIHGDCIEQKMISKSVDLMVTQDSKPGISISYLAEGGTILSLNFSTDNFVLDQTILQKNVSIVPVAVTSLLEDIDDPILISIKNMISVDIQKGIVRPFPTTISLCPERMQNNDRVVSRIRDESNKILPVEIVPITYFDPEKAYLIFSELNVFDIEVVDFMVLRGARTLILHSSNPIENTFLEYKLSVWEIKGCKVTIVKDVSLKNAFEKLLSTENICGVFYLSIFGSLKFLKLLDDISRTVCPRISFTVLVGADGYDQESIIRKRIAEGLHGKIVYWTEIDDIPIQELATYVMDLDVLLSSTHPVVSRSHISERPQVKEEESVSFLDTVLRMIGIADKSSLTLQTTLNVLGVDSLMSSQIQEILKANYNINLTSDEIRMLTVEQLGRMSKTN